MQTGTDGPNQASLQCIALQLEEKGPDRSSAVTNVYSLKMFPEDVTPPFLLPCLQVMFQLLSSVECLLSKNPLLPGDLLDKVRDNHNYQPDKTPLPSLHMQVFGSPITYWENWLSQQNLPTQISTVRHNNGFAKENNQRKPINK